MLRPSSKNRTIDLCRKSIPQSMMAFIALSLIGQTSCSSLVQTVNSKVAPQSADFNPTPITAPTGTLDYPTEFYNYYVKNLKKCNDIKQTVVDANNGLNAWSDYTALILTSLASIFTPVVTIHELTAGAAISTGLKTTIAQDITADDTKNISIAFDKIYFVPMAQLWDKSSTVTWNSATYVYFKGQVDDLTTQCTLDEARLYISQNLTNGQPVNPDQGIAPASGSDTPPPPTANPPTPAKAGT